MPVEDLRIVALPLSGWQFQVRADGSWRDLGVDGWSEGDYKDTWVPATELFAYNGRWEDDDGRGGEGWWLLYGNVPRGDAVKVTLADGRQPSIIEFGPLWLCEWVSARQVAVVAIGDTSSAVFERMSMYLAPDE
jgi:hypothetical protein